MRCWCVHGCVFYLLYKKFNVLQSIKNVVHHLVDRNSEQKCYFTDTVDITLYYICLNDFERKYNINVATNRVRTSHDHTTLPNHTIRFKRKIGYYRIFSTRVKIFFLNRRHSYKPRDRSNCLVINDNLNILNTRAALRWAYSLCVCSIIRKRPFFSQ